MYFLRTYKKESHQHIFTLENYEETSMCGDIQYSVNDIQVSLEFEDLDELLEFYPSEIKRKPICKQCWTILNSKFVGLNEKS